MRIHELIPWRTIRLHCRLTAPEAVDALARAFAKDEASEQRSFDVRRRGDTFIVRYRRERWRNGFIPVADVWIRPTAVGSELLARIHPSYLVVPFMALWFFATCAGGVLGLVYAIRDVSAIPLVALAIPSAGAIMFWWSFWPKARAVEAFLTQAIPIESIQSTDAHDIMEGHI